MKPSVCLVVCGLVILVPTMALAHPSHAPGAPDHPIDSPDYHQTSDVSAVSTTKSDQTLLAMLLQLVALLQEQLAQLVSGDTPSTEDVQQVACTEDAMLCPDGSYVARVAPSCAFAACPSGTTTNGQISATGDLTMTTDDTYRYFSADGLPEYDISDNRYASEPSVQDHDFRVPLQPIQNDQPTYYTLPFTFGIALNGVTFEPFAAEWFNDDQGSGWQEDPFVTLRGLDEQNAHVQPSGLYHYHGQPTNLLSSDGSSHSPVIGFAADGFPLYGPHVYQTADDADSEITTLDSSYQLRSGTRPSGPGGSYDGTYNEDYEHVARGSNALDECNGRFGVTPEFPNGTYYYVATESFPYIPRCLMGDMDPSFQMTHGGSGPR